MNIFELLLVYIWILWLAYRWWIIAAVLGLAWYGQSQGLAINLDFSG